MKELFVLFVLTVASVVATEPPPHSRKDAVEQARQYVKDHLKSPATAVFTKETVCGWNEKVDFEDAKGTGTPHECFESAEQIGEGYRAVTYRGFVDSPDTGRMSLMIKIGFADGKWEVYDLYDAVRLLWNGCKALDEAGRLPLSYCKKEYPSMYIH